MSQLRKISVHVNEQDLGRFVWVLMEEGEDPSVWVQHSSSQKPYRHWNHALTDGTAALMDLAHDVRKGPRRSTVEDDAADRAAPADGGERPDP